MLNIYIHPVHVTRKTVWLERMSGEACAIERLVGCRLVRTHTSLEREKYKQVERETENPVSRPTDWRLDIGRTVVINILCSTSGREYIIIYNH